MLIRRSSDLCLLRRSRISLPEYEKNDTISIENLKMVFESLCEIK